jgi:Cys-tRNA(Pro) deacylase
VAKERFHTTQAIRTLREHGVDFRLHPYKYEERGGTEVAARELQIDEHRAVKTLVLEDEKGDPFLVLMHGDKQVSTKALARFLGVKSVRPCEPHVANRHTGYVVGGTSPFGTRKRLKVYVEASILDLHKVFINAGKRGLLAEMSPADITRVLNPIPVQAAI